MFKKLRTVSFSTGCCPLCAPSREGGKMKAVFKVWENLPLRGSTERTREEEEGAVPGRRPPHTHQLLIVNHQARRGQGGRSGAGPVFWFCTFALLES